MPDTDTTAVTRPARKRAAKPAGQSPAPVAPKPASSAAGEDGRERYSFALVAAGETKSYAKFVPPIGSGCVGTIYAPLGTEEVKVLFIGGVAQLVVD